MVFPQWFGFEVTLRQGNREYFYQKLDEHFLGLRQQYHQKYGYSYVLTSDHNDRLMSMRSVRSMVLRLIIKGFLST